MPQKAQIFLWKSVPSVARKSKLKYMVPMQPVLKLQGLQTLPAQTIHVFLLDKYTLLVCQLYLRTLALGNIADFTFKRTGTACTFFGFVGGHSATN